MERNVITRIVANDDRISELPDSVVHHILSFLATYNPAQLIRTSVLSKRWFALTASFPILVFDFDRFSYAAKDKFFKYVAYTTSRFSQQQNVITANTFDLRADLKDVAYASIVDRCLELVLKQGLQVFLIHSCRHYYSVQPPMYRLPNVLLFVSSLTSLSIRDCEMPSSLMVSGDDVVKFKSLKLLSLGGVYLNEDMIKCLTAGCPLLEKFNVYQCYGFKRFCVYGLQNLRKVKLYYVHEVEEIDIQAPSLSKIFLYPTSTGDKPPRTNLFSGKKLTMIFCGRFSEQFAVSLSSFPFLDTLILELSYNCRNFKLSSHSLRMLSLDAQIGLDKIEIDTPNLHYFQYYFRRPIVLPSVRNSGPLKACMECYPHCDTDWFQQFRRFFGQVNYIQSVEVEYFHDVEGLNLLDWAPFELEHIELKMLGISDYLRVVEAVLWCCRPKSLTLKPFYISDERRDQMVKFTYEKLLQQEDKGKTNIQIVFSTVKAGRSNDLLITFLKEEVGQKASQEAG